TTQSHSPARDISESMKKTRTTVDRHTLRWLIPGLRIKRWLLLMIFGMALIGLGIGYVQVQIYRQADVPEIFYYLTLQFLDRWIRAVLVGGIGISAFVVGFYYFNRSIIQSVRGNDSQPIL